MQDLLRLLNFTFQGLSTFKHDKVVVGVGVVADCVPPGDDETDQVRESLDPVSVDEKCGTNLVPGQKFQQQRGRCGIGTVVKGQRDGLFFGWAAADDRQVKAETGQQRCGETQDDK